MTDTDRLARRQQITRLQQAVEQRKHARVLGDALEDRTARDQRVDTLRAAALEIVSAAVTLEMRRQRFAYRMQIGRHQNIRSAARRGGKEGVSTCRSRWGPDQ